jgi:hypothetical protein
MIAFSISKSMDLKSLRANSLGSSNAGSISGFRFVPKGILTAWF